MIAETIQQLRIILYTLVGCAVFISVMCLKISTTLDSIDEKLTNKESKDEQEKQ